MKLALTAAGMFGVFGVIWGLLVGKGKEKK